MTPPFFIVGAGRSGTTLLRLILCGHPRIFIPPEAWFLGDLMSQLPVSGPLTKDQLAEAEMVILASDRWKDWDCPAAKLREILARCERLDQASLIDRLFRDVFNHSEEMRWGEKSPRHSHIVERIDRIFPTSQFIHMIRDGRDVTSSMLQRGWFGKNPRRVAEHWSSCVAGARRASAFGADRYYEVRFESLIADPATEVKHLCHFLGMDFSDRMLAYQDQVRKFVPAGEAGFHHKLSGALRAGEVGKWKETLGPWEESVFWSVAKTQMRDYYPGSSRRPASRLLGPLTALWVRANRAYCILASKFPSNKPS